MRPRLKDGKPIGQYQRPKPGHDRPYYLCCCEFCRVGGVARTAEGEVKGRYFRSGAEIEAHRQFIDSQPRESARSSTYAAPLPHPAAVPISTVLDSTIPSLSPASSDLSSIPVAVSMGPTPVDECDRMKSPRDEDNYDLTKLRAIQEQLEREKSYPSWDPTDIEFIGDPSTSPTLPESRDHLLLLRKGPSNSFIRGHLEWLKQSSDFVATLSKTIPSYQSYSFQNVRKVVQRELDRQTVLAWIKVEEEWNRQRQIALRKQRRVKAHSVSYADIDPSKQSYLIIWILAAVMHFVCNVAVERMSFLLGGLRIVAGLQGGAPDEIVSFIPKEMDTIAARLDLEPHFTTFACCPRCFQLYDSDNLPDRCSNKAAADSKPCGRRLRPSDKRPAHSRKARSGTKPPSLPKRSFLQQDLEHWIGWMYSRSAMEHWLDRPYSNSPSDNSTVYDMWDSSFLRTFLGPDGEKPFLSPPPGTDESRLIFNLNSDGFNPFGNRTAGKKVSIGGIYLVCMNLPPSLRHKPENVFLVGIIPGPREPSMDQINYILRPLVDVLERLWETGMYINRTHQHPRGRTVRAALGALVCDMPAARLLAGFSHYSSNTLPCSMCKVSDVNELDEEFFRPRTASEHREKAEAWLEARSETERKRLYEQNGVRWSELLRLRYWDPVQNTIIDPMHGFYLRILQRHCRDIWGMSVNLEDCDGLWELDEPTDEQKSTARNVFRYGSAAALKQLRTNALRYLALQEGLEHRRKKNSLLVALLQLRVTRNWFDANNNRLPITGQSSDTPSDPDSVPEIEVDAEAMRVVDENDEIVKARKEYRDGKTKEGFRNFSPDTIRQLSDELGVTATTGKGKPSRSKANLIDMLVQKRKEAALISPPETLNQPGNTLNKDSVEQLYERAPKRVINKMKWPELKGICLFIGKLKARRTQEGEDDSMSGSDHSDDQEDSSYGEEFIFEEGGLSSDPEDDTDRNSQILRMQNFIHKNRYDSGITNRAGRLKRRTKKGKAGIKKAGVLGKQTLADVRRDMERLSLPSWLARAPSRPGETMHGKFSADQWRTFCTVNLPITLIRRWGSLPKNERKYQMLANYMQLVSAVRLANMREMTEKRIQYFEELIRLYLKGIQELYPHTNITIYQHMMHHFGSLLRRFGPVHSWRCFAFERLNYVLQQTSTNNKLGELEKTMFRRFCMTQKLRSVFHGTALPAYLVSLASIYEKCFESSDTRGTRITDVLAWEMASEDSLTEKIDWSNQAQLTALDMQTFEALSHAVKSLMPGVAFRLSPHVHDWKRVDWREFTFTTQSCAFSDAQIVFDNDKGWSAGSIDGIFSARWIADGSHHCSTFARVKEYSPLSQHDSQFDNYRDLGFAGGRLFYNRFEKEPIVLPLNQLISHFGFSIQSVPSITTEVFHALPLNKTFEFDT